MQFMKPRLVGTPEKAEAWKKLFGVCVVWAICLQASAQVFTNLVNFTGGIDGANPIFVSLAQGRDGNLWGTTQAGGNAQVGTMFKMTPDGDLTPCLASMAPTEGILMQGWC